jgi:hypothetical protein
MPTDPPDRRLADVTLINPYGVSAGVNETAAGGNSRCTGGSINGRQYQWLELSGNEYQLSVITFVLAPSGDAGPGNRREA